MKREFKVGDKVWWESTNLVYKAKVVEIINEKEVIIKRGRFHRTVLARNLQHRKTFWDRLFKRKPKIVGQSMTIKGSRGNNIVQINNGWDKSRGFNNPAMDGTKMEK